MGQKYNQKGWQLHDSVLVGILARLKCCTLDMTYQGGGYHKFCQWPGWGFLQ